MSFFISIKALCPCLLVPTFLANTNSKVSHRTRKAEQGRMAVWHGVLLEELENPNCWINFLCLHLALVLALMMTAKMEAVVGLQELPKSDENLALLERSQLLRAFQKMAVNGEKGK